MNGLITGAAFLGGAAGGLAVAICLGRRWVRRECVEFLRRYRDYAAWERRVRVIIVDRTRQGVSGHAVDVAAAGPQSSARRHSAAFSSAVPAATGAATSSLTAEDQEILRELFEQNLEIRHALAERSVPPPHFPSLSAGCAAATQPLQPPIAKE